MDSFGRGGLVSGVGHFPSNFSGTLWLIAEA